MPFIDRVTWRHFAGDFHPHGPSFPLLDELVLAQMPEKSFLRHFPALELHQSGIRLQMAVNRHADLPRPREHVLVFDGRFVAERVARDRSVPFHDMKRSRTGLSRSGGSRQTATSLSRTRRTSLSFGEYSLYNFTVFWLFYFSRMGIRQLAYRSMKGYRHEGDFKKLVL